MTAHGQLTLTCQQSLIHAQRVLRLTMQYVHGHNGHWCNECADHAAALGTFGLISKHNLATRWIHHYFLTLQSVSMTVATSARSWNDCSTFEQMQRHFIKKRASVGASQWTHRVICAVHVTYGRVSLSLSSFPFGILLLQTSDGQTLHPRLPNLVLTTASNTACGSFCCNCFSSTKFVVFLLPPSSLISTWPGTHLSLCS